MSAETALRDAATRFVADFELWRTCQADETVLDSIDDLRAALASPESRSLDVETLAEAWGNVMDGRRLYSDGVVRLDREATTADDWHAIAAEYARLREHVR